MKKVTLDKNAIAIGLYWASLAGEKPSAEVSIMASEVDRPYGFTRKVVKEDGTSSFQVALTDEKSLLGVISGAAAIAEKFIDIVFVEKISEQEVWICAIVDSEILVGGDVLVNISSTVESFNSIVKNYKKSPIFVYGKSFSDHIKSESKSNHLDFGSLPDPDEIYSFGELLEQAQVVKFGKEFKAFKIASVESKSKNVMMGIIVLGLIGGIGYTQFGDQILGKGNREIPTISVPDIIKSNKESSEDILSRAKKEEIQWLRDEFNKSDPSSLVRRILAFDMIQDKHINGWSAIDLSYDAIHPRDISVHWLRSEVGTPLSLRVGVDNSKDVNFNLDGNTATIVFDVVDRIDNGYGKGFDIVSYIEDSPYKHENMMHDLISMNYKWSMSRHDFGERPSKILGLDKSDRKNENVRQLKSEATNVIIQGENRDQLSALIKIFEVAKTFKINKVSISLGGISFKWRVEGVLYEK